MHACTTLHYPKNTHDAHGSLRHGGLRGEADGASSLGVVSCLVCAGVLESAALYTSLYARDGNKHVLPSTSLTSTTSRVYDLCAIRPIKAQGRHTNCRNLMLCEYLLNLREMRCLVVSCGNDPCGKADGRGVRMLTKGVGKVPCP